MAGSGTTETVWCDGAEEGVLSTAKGEEEEVEVAIVVNGFDREGSFPFFSCV